MNVGSSSIKSSLRYGDVLYWRRNYEDIISLEQRRATVKLILSEVRHKKIKIDAIVHRVVHGGDIKKTSFINESLLKKLKKTAELAPLHVIPEIDVIELCRKFTTIPQIAVFDTTFHRTIPTKASIYGLPYKYFKKGIKRYGFHGISHEFVSRGIKGKVISCHIGNGCSITAIKDGKSVDNSMGFTPLEGLMMGTRSGSIDPAIIPYLIIHHETSIKEISNILNYQSGLLGISGTTHDLRKLLVRKDKRSKLAVDAFIYRIVKQIGAYVAALNGVDTIIFTAGITQNNFFIRKKILENLTFLNIEVDDKKNRANNKIISKNGSKVKIMVIPTNEEYEMAKQAEILLLK